MVTLLLTLAVAALGGNGLPQGSEPVKLDPADFVAKIDNPYLPMAVGSTWVYRETDREGHVARVVVNVTSRHKKIVGIDATVVHDVLTENGKVKENTWDWYGQDKHGNVWYLGEDTKEYENGKLSSTKGSWQAGVDGAQPGVVMPAHPKVGLSYRQEYYAGEAEDRATVLSVKQRARVPFGSFSGLVMTEDTTPLEPKVLEHKYFARGVGQVLATSRGGGREVLVRYTR